MGTTEANLFKFDQWYEKMAWRGYFSSAETAGEFYGIAIMFLIFPILKYKKLNLSVYFWCVFHFWDYIYQITEQCQSCLLQDLYFIY